MAQARVRAAQVIVAEAVLVAVAAAYAGPTWLFAGVLVGGGGVLLATFGRVDGRWWYQAALGHRRLSRRRERVAAELVAATISGEPPDATAAWLRTLAPDLRVRPVTVRGSGGGEVGVGSDAHGWFGVVAVGDLLEAPPASAVPLADLCRGGQALSSASLVMGERGQPRFAAVRLSAAGLDPATRLSGSPAGSPPRWAASPVESWPVNPFETGGRIRVR